MQLGKTMGGKAVGVKIQLGARVRIALWGGGAGGDGEGRGMREGRLNKVGTWEAWPGQQNVYF